MKKTVDIGPACIAGFSATYLGRGNRGEFEVTINVGDQSVTVPVSYDAYGTLADRFARPPSKCKLIIEYEDPPVSTEVLAERERCIDILRDLSIDTSAAIEKIRRGS